MADRAAFSVDVDGGRSAPREIKIESELNPPPTRPPVCGWCDLPPSPAHCPFAGAKTRPKRDQIAPLKVTTVSRCIPLLTFSSLA